MEIEKISFSSLMTSSNIGTNTDKHVVPRSKVKVSLVEVKSRFAVEYMQVWLEVVETRNVQWAVYLWQNRKK